MSCPTCEYTMHGLGKVPGGNRVFWCPRCGTLREQTDDGVATNDRPPSLPKRVQAFLMQAELTDGNRKLAHVVGLNEASGFKWD